MMRAVQAGPSQPEPDDQLDEPIAGIPSSGGRALVILPIVILVIGGIIALVSLYLRH